MVTSASVQKLTASSVSVRTVAVRVPRRITRGASVIGTVVQKVTGPGRKLNGLGSFMVALRSSGDSGKGWQALGHRMKPVS